MTDPVQPSPPRPQDEKTLETTPILPAQELFQGQREVWIEHEGVRYRLRITRRNKLILQK